MKKVIVATSATVVVVAALFVVFILVAAKPIGTDLSTIGQGRPTLVLAYENWSPSGGVALNNLRSIKRDYESRLDFRVADMGTPDGRAFADRHQLIDGRVVFLGPDGEPLRVADVPTDEQALRRNLDEKLAAVE